MHFHPYHPLRLRLWLALGLLAAVALTAWGAWGFQSSSEPREILRAGLSLGLAAGFIVMLFKTRPRAGWGVQLTTQSVLVSRLGHGVIEVPLREVRELRRLGEKRDTLMLALNDRERVLVPAHLFSRRAHFEALVQQLEERLPARYDA